MHNPFFNRVKTFDDFYELNLFWYSTFWGKFLLHWSNAILFYYFTHYFIKLQLVIWDWDRNENNFMSPLFSFFIGAFFPLILCIFAYARGLMFFRSHAYFFCVGGLYSTFFGLQSMSCFPLWRLLIDEYDKQWEVKFHIFHVPWSQNQWQSDRYQFSFFVLGNSRFLWTGEPSSCLIIEPIVTSLFCKRSNFILNKVRIGHILHYDEFSTQSISTCFALTTSCNYLFLKSQNILILDNWDQKVGLHLAFQRIFNSWVLAAKNTAKSIFCFWIESKLRKHSVYYRNNTVFWWRWDMEARLRNKQYLDFYAQTLDVYVLPRIFFCQLFLSLNYGSTRKYKCLNRHLPVFKKQAL